MAILTPIYELEFLGFSYGFQPKRNQHQALDALAFVIGKRRINWVLDCDVQSFFDKVSREWLSRFVEHRIGDGRIIRLIAKWLTAGVLEDGRMIETEEGTPQRAVISPRRTWASHLPCPSIPSCRACHRRPRAAPRGRASGTHIRSQGRPRAPRVRSAAKSLPGSGACRVPPARWRACGGRCGPKPVESRPGETPVGSDLAAEQRQQCGASGRGVKLQHIIAGRRVGGTGVVVVERADAGKLHITSAGTTGRAKWKEAAPMPRQGRN